MSVLLEVSGLCVSYGKVLALEDIDITVREGEIVTVIGSNGAGKSTLLLAVMGVLKSQGMIGFGLRKERLDTVEARVAAGIGLVPETRELFGSMNVEDNLLLGSFHLRGLGRRNLAGSFAEVFEMFPRLLERRNQLAQTLSGGERQMLALGRALMARPRLLMLDEPSLGLAPLVVRDIFRIIEVLRARGVAVLLVEQNARAALQIADRGYVLETGQIALSGAGQALLSDPRVAASYLGVLQNEGRATP